MRTRLALLVAVIFGLIPAAAVYALSPRIVFERVLPPAHDLGDAHEVAIVEAPTSDPRIDVFVEELVHHVNRSGSLRLRDARVGSGPAEAHLDIKTFHCEAAQRETEGGFRDVDGKRVKQRAFQISAVCGARIEVLSRFLRPTSTFFAKGEGTSRRLESVTDEERENAMADAARYAAIDATERITPRRVRESIALDASAPAFAEGMAMIEAGRFAEARAIWQRAMQTQARSAALRFNLAAVSEAMGDRRAAELHYNAARQLAPAEVRYASELKLFAQRGRGTPPR
jgi:tetratricopeptide (TPR) repeat protein